MTAGARTAEAADTHDGAALVVSLVGALASAQQWASAPEFGALAGLDRTRDRDRSRRMLSQLSLLGWAERADHATLGVRFRLGWRVPALACAAMQLVTLGDRRPLQRVRASAPIEVEGPVYHRGTLYTCRVLDAVALAGGWCPAATLATEAGLDTRSAARIADALVTADWLDAEAGARRYRLGTTFLAFGPARIASLDAERRRITAELDALQSGRTPQE